jgi:hypothetical protein
LHQLPLLRHHRRRSIGLPQQHVKITTICSRPLRIPCEISAVPFFPCIQMSGKIIVFPVAAEQHTCTYV